MGLTIILVLVAVFVILFALMGFKIVQQSETMVIERLGKYNQLDFKGKIETWSQGSCKASDSDTKREKGGNEYFHH